MAPKIDTVIWSGLACRIAIRGQDPGAVVDIRTKRGDSSTSLVKGGKLLGDDSSVSLIVDEEDCAGTAAFVVLTDSDGTVVTEGHTVVGGT